MLTEEQLQRIDAYIVQRNVLYYDVRIELADHLGEQVMAAMNTDGLSFDEALQQYGAIFAKDWAAIVQYRTKYLRRKFLRTMGKEILHFFSWPKITLTLCLTALMVYIARHQVTKISNILFLLNAFIVARYYMSRDRRRNTQKIRDMLQKVKGLQRNERLVVARELKERSVFFRLLVGRQLMKTNFYFSALGMLYVLSLFACVIWGPQDSILLYRIFFGLLPFMLMLYIAWSKTYSSFQAEIRRNYPEFI